MDKDTQTALEALEREARALYGSDDVEIDPLTEKDISQSESGTWVRAWVFVPNGDDDD